MYTLDEQLVVALKKKNYDEAENLLSQGADINAVNSRGESPVFMFASTLTQEALKWLINHGANLDIPNKMGLTPLFAAVERSDLVAVDLLLNAGADVNITNARRISPIFQAVLNEKDKGVFDRLMEANPDLNIESESGTTVVLAAAARGNANFVQKLLQAGADPEAADYLGQGLLHAATSSNEASVLRTVLDYAPFLDPNYEARSGTSAMSTTLGNSAMISMMLEVGGNPNARSANRVQDGVSLIMGVLGQDPISDIPMKKKKGDNDMSAQIGMMMGMMGGSPDLLDTMLQKGASATQRDDNGNNPAYYAMCSGATRHLPTLVAYGLDPTRPANPSGFLPYDLLAGPMVDWSNEKCVELIQEWHAQGFPLSRPQWDEKIDGLWTRAISQNYAPMQTVLQSYVGVGFWDGVKELLNLGANINEQGLNKNTLAHTVVGSGMNGMTQATQKALAMAQRVKNIDESTKQEQLKEILKQAEDNLAELRDLFNSHNIDWSAQTEGGNTPLHIAAKKGHTEWARYLMMDIQVDPTIKNAEGLTPAGVALSSGNLELFHALSETAQSRGFNVRREAVLATTKAFQEDSRERKPWLQALASYDWSDKEINLADEDGKTALYHASSNGLHDVVRVLLRLKADPDIQASTGNTCLMEATFQEDGEIIRMLRAVGTDMTLKNKGGATVEDVANYVKSRYVHDALSMDNLGHLIQDLDVPPMNEAQKILKDRFNHQLANAVRYFNKEEALPLPELTEEEAKIVEEELNQQQLKAQGPVLGGQPGPASAPAKGAAMTAPRAANQPKQPFKTP